MSAPTTNPTLPVLSQLVGHRGDTLATIAAVFVSVRPPPGQVHTLTAGETLVIHSRGCWRTATLEKVGKKRLAVAYRTESGHITRKSVDLTAAFLFVSRKEAGQ